MDNSQEKTLLQKLNDLLNYLVKEAAYLRATGGKEMRSEANGIEYTINKVKDVLGKSNENN